MDWHLSAKRQAAGVYLSWAYSPGEVQILTSPDGTNFAETACWRPSSQTDASYAEHIMFDKVLAVRAVTVVMRGPRAWGYFALASVSLLAEPGPTMLVSGMTAPNGERCAVAQSGGVSLTPCVGAVAAGTGAEVFRLTGEGLLSSNAFPDECAVLVDGDATDGGHIALTPCRSARQAEDGRAVFASNAAGQLSIALGGLCVIARGGSLAVADCGSASKSENAADKFFFIAVPEFDPTCADAARSSATLALNAAGRLEGLLGRLDQSLPLLASCTLGQHLALSDRRPAALSQTSGTKRASKSSVHDPNAAATESMNDQLKIGSIVDVIAHARASIASAHRQF